MPALTIFASANGNGRASFAVTGIGEAQNGYVVQGVLSEIRNNRVLLGLGIEKVWCDGDGLVLVLFDEASVMPCLQFVALVNAVDLLWIRWFPPYIHRRRVDCFHPHFGWWSFRHYVYKN